MSRAPLFNRGFLSLFATQFFEAAGDNIIKGALGYAVAVGGPWHDRIGDGGQGFVSFLFTIPFVLFSAFGGRLADRFSKRSSTVALKTVSIVVAAVTLLGFWGDSLALSLVALALFAIVSSFFGPVKYGMIAELVDRDEIVRANGVINVGTNLAVISGTIIAGAVATAFSNAHAPEAEGTVTQTSGLLAPGITMLAFSLLGWLTCLTLPKLAAQSPDLPLDPNPFTTYWESLRHMAKGPLIVITLFWTFFYFLAAIVLAMLADYPQILGVSPLKASALSAAMGIAIGVGCVAAAWLSGKRSRLEFVPLGAAGLALAFLLLGIAPKDYWLIGALLSVMGLAAGFYIIPLQASLQELSPSGERGRFIGTANAMSFVMVGLGSLLFVGLSKLGMPSNRMFLPLAALTAVAGVLVYLWLRRETRLGGPSRSSTLPAP